MTVRWPASVGSEPRAPPAAPERRVPSEPVREVLAAGERIESYPDDTPLPNYLMLGAGEGRVLHVVAADDEARDETIVITSYEPDPKEWESDFGTRKR